MEKEREKDGGQDGGERENVGDLGLAPLTFIRTFSLKRRKTLF